MMMPRLLVALFWSLLSQPLQELRPGEYNMSYVDFKKGIQ